MKTSQITNWLLLALWLAPITVLADSSYSLGGDEVHLKSSAPSQVAPAAADSKLDDSRLPPTIPGEEITRNGKKYRVWSTSGPVPVSEAPEPWRRRNERGLDRVKGGVGVVLDQRTQSTGSNGQQAPSAPAQ